MRSKPEHNRMRSGGEDNRKGAAPESNRIDVTLDPEDAALVRKVAQAKRLAPAAYARSAIVQQAERDAAEG